MTKKILVENLKFDTVFRICTSAMRIDRCHPDIPRDKVWRAQFVFILFLCITCFIVLSYSAFYDMRLGLFAGASKNATMSIVAFIVIYNFFILLRYQESVTELIRIVDKDYEMTKDFCEEEQRIVIHYAERGVKACQYWLISALSASAVFPLKAFILMGKSYMAGDFVLEPMFEVTYPIWIIEDYKDVPVMFFMLFAHEFVFDFYAALMYIAFDPLVPIFLLHLCGQIDILNLRISRILDSQDSDETVRKNISKIVMKLQDIYKFIEVIKINFTVLYEFKMKTTTFILPLSAFQVTESLRNGAISVEFITFFTVVILHFFLICYYSDLLMETGERFRLAVYSCGWEKHSDMRALHSILLMLTRAIKPMVISTIFCAICLDTFAEMCRQAYSIFNLMNAAWT